jgi:hypothetical protein
MAKYYMEVKTPQLKRCGCGIEMVWSKVRPTHGRPYEYNTYNEAFSMLEMCYGATEILGKTVRITKE